MESDFTLPRVNLNLIYLTSVFSRACRIDFRVKAFRVVSGGFLFRPVDHGRAVRITVNRTTGAVQVDIRLIRGQYNRKTGGWTQPA